MSSQTTTNFAAYEKWARGAFKEIDAQLRMVDEEIKKLSLPDELLRLSMLRDFELLLCRRLDIIVFGTLNEKYELFKHLTDPSRGVKP